MGYDAVHDKMKEECGVFGIWAVGHSEEAANFTYLGLHALQHRGQEAAGIVARTARPSTCTGRWASSRTSSTPRCSRA
jgi:glutamate synthase domain-containing protein 1